MLDIYNHLAVFGLMVVCGVLGCIIADYKASISCITGGVNLALWLMAIGEITAFSIWYLSGAPS
jgi:hypothetical protein